MKVKELIMASEARIYLVKEGGEHIGFYDPNYDDWEVDSLDVDDDYNIVAEIYDPDEWGESEMSRYDPWDV